METDTATLVADGTSDVEDPEDLVVEELLIEEISIDGMCGVY
jgi:mycofactocin precursor